MATLSDMIAELERVTEERCVSFRGVAARRFVLAESPCFVLAGDGLAVHSFRVLLPTCLVHDHSCVHTHNARGLHRREVEKELHAEIVTRARQDVLLDTKDQKIAQLAQLNAEASTSGCGMACALFVAAA